MQMRLDQIIKPRLFYLLGLLLVLGCSKSVTQYEPYTFSGTVYECYTNNAMAGVKVSIVAKSLGNGGFSNSVYQAGSVVTNSNGQFSINPVRYPGITDYSILLEKDGYISNGVAINADTLTASGPKTYSYPCIMGKLTYLKLILNDTHPYDSTDKIYLHLFPLAGCVLYTPTFSNSNIAVDSNLADETGIYGLIINGNAVYRVNANDSCYVQYHYWKNNIMSAFFTNAIFCPGGDTATMYINY